MAPVIVPSFSRGATRLQQQMQRLMGWLAQVKAVFERGVAARGEEDGQDDSLWAQP